MLIGTRCRVAVSNSARRVWLLFGVTSARTGPIPWGCAPRAVQGHGVGTTGANPGCILPRSCPTRCPHVMRGRAFPQRKQPSPKTALASVRRHHKPQLPPGCPTTAQKLFKELWLRPPPEWSRLFSAASSPATLTGCSPGAASSPARALAAPQGSSPRAVPWENPSGAGIAAPRSIRGLSPSVPFSTR